MTEEVAAGVRGRTRRAILDAAVAVLSRNPHAPLAEVAEAAQVGRTTVHRYFAERADLVDAVSADGLHRLDAALRRARPDEGTGREALLRACRELFDLGELLTLVFGPVLLSRPEWQGTGEVDRALLAVVARGHADGSLDPALPPDWVQSLLWTVLYAADSHGRDCGGSRHDALALALRTLDGALRPLH